MRRSHRRNEQIRLANVSLVPLRALEGFLGALSLILLPACDRLIIFSHLPNFAISVADTEFMLFSEINLALINKFVVVIQKSTDLH